MTPQCDFGHQIALVTRTGKGMLATATALA